MLKLQISFSQWEIGPFHFHKDQEAMNCKINSGVSLSLQKFGTLRAKSDAQTFQQYSYFL